MTQKLPPQNFNQPILQTSYKSKPQKGFLFLIFVSNACFFESGKMKKVPIVSHHNIVLYRTILNI